MDILTATAGRAAAGETVSGDMAACFVDGPSVTVALADGLGHGPRAAEAATAFCAFVAERQGDAVDRILHGATRALAKTRGAAAAVLRIDGDAGTATFGGIGNIELRQLGGSASHCPAVCLPGIVGRQLRRVKAFSFDVAPGTTLVLFIATEAAWQVATAVSELATNAAKFAGGGRVTLSTADDVLTVTVEDDGPGLDDIERAFVDGWSEGRMVDTPAGRRGLGWGLGAVRRLMDDATAANRPTGGLLVTASKRAKRDR